MIDDENFFTSNIMRDAQAEHLRAWNEDNAEEWWHHLDLEAQRWSEDQAGPSAPDTRDILQILSSAVGLLASIPADKYPVIADLRQRLLAECKSLQHRKDISLNDLVVTAKRIFNK